MRPTLALHAPTLASALAPPLALGLGAILVASALVASSTVDAQRRRRPRNIPFAGTPVEWTLFVSPHGTTPALRTPITAEPGSVPLPETPYQCSFGAPNRVAISAENWSETRSIECRFGTTIVSASGFCQVSGASWGPRAAVLGLTEEGSTERLEVSIDCAVRPPQ